MSRTQHETSNSSKARHVHVQPTSQTVYGVDLGTSKIVISKSSSVQADSKTLLPDVYCASPVTIADKMDIRNIPNRIMLSPDPDQIRAFGNSVSVLKAYDMNFDAYTKKHNVQIGSENYTLFGFFIKNMIMSHVKDVITYRSTDTFPDQSTKHPTDNLVKIVTVFDRRSDIKDKFLDFQSIKCIMSAETKHLTDTNSSNTKYEIIPIRDDHAVIMSYLDKYILHDNSNFDLAKNVLIIDAGYFRTSFVSFSVVRTDGITKISNISTIASEKLSGKHIDIILANLLVEKAKMVDPKFKADSKGSKLTSESKLLRSELQKIKHQLSSNSTVKVTLQGADKDLSFYVDRDEFEKTMISEDLDEIMKESLKTIMSLVKPLNNGKLDSAKLDSKTDHKQVIDHVEMIGGTSRVPLMRNLVKHYLVEKSIMPSGFELPQCMNQDEAVSNGACVYGWLLSNPKIAEKIKFEKYVHTSAIKRLERNECALNENKNVTVAIPMYSGEASLCLTNHKHILFTIADKNYVKKSVNDETEIFVTFKEDVTTMLEIVDVRDNKGDKIEYDIMLFLTDDEPTMLEELLKEYKLTEENILRSKDFIVRKQNLGNFMESYYYDVSGVNKLINSINQKESLSKNSLHNVLSVESIPTKALHSPLKEVYEFYHFCKTYTEEATSDATTKKKEYIQKLLEKEDSLAKLEEAVTIIIGIKSKYS